MCVVDVVDVVDVVNVATWYHSWCSELPEMVDREMLIDKDNWVAVHRQDSWTLTNFYFTIYICE